MPSNTTLNVGASGDIITTKERTHDGDATKQQVVSLAFVTGTEGAYTHTDAVGGAGAVTAGVQRTTLASDDPAVVALQLLDNAVSGSGYNITQLNGVNVTMGNGASGTGVQRVTIANDSTGILAAVTNVATIGTSVTPGTSAAHLGKAVDAIAGGSDTGIALLAVRDDALATLTPADGDYTHLRVSSTGALHVTGSAGMTQYTEDAASAGGESLCLMGAVRRDSAASSGGTDGDYVTLNTNATGALRVASDNGIAGIVDDAAFTPATSEVLPVGFTFDNTATDSVDEGDIGAARMSANRNIYVNIRDNAGNERGLNVDASGFIGVTDGGGSLTVDASNLSCNVAQMNGVAVTMGNGAAGTGVQRVTVANDSTGILAGVTTVTTLTNITNQGQIVDDAAFTPATTRVMMSGYFADETSTDSVDEGDGGAARMTLDRKQITTEYVHAAAGGTSMYSSISTAAVLSAVIKASAGKVWAINVMNINAAARFVRIYNQTGAPGSGDAANILWRGIIPGATTGAGFTVYLKGLQCSTGIGIRASTGIADNDTGALAANELVFNVEYV